MTVKEFYERAVKDGFENKDIRIDCKFNIGTTRRVFEPMVIGDEVYI